MGFRLKGAGFRAWRLGLVCLRDPNASTWTMSMLCIGVFCASS